MINNNSLRTLAMLAGILICGITICQETSFTYISPVDGSSGLNPEQNIILKHIEGLDAGVFDRTVISITGDRSGTMEFEYFFDDNNSSLILCPETNFMLGEQVEVRYAGGLSTREGKLLSPLVIRFDIINHDRDELHRRIADLVSEPEPVNTFTTEDLPVIPLQDNNLPPDYPPPTVYNYDVVDNRYFFYNTVCRNFSLPWESYITIVDAYGVPVYYNKSNFVRHNFSMLPDGHLCYAISTLPNGPREKYFIMDSTFTVIDSVNTGNGYYLDSHDMLLLDNGHYLVMSYDPQPVDMSQVVSGGNPNAIVTGLVIQEVDNDENVFFQWRSWDHFEITDATWDIDLTAAAIDYVHGNAFEIDADGHILLSSRNMDEITKINFNTGAIIWRFGVNCENNMFQIQNDPIGFSHQHDIRRTSNGRYTIYDNGNLNIPQESRALEYIINQQQLTASLEWSYVHPNHIYASSTGSFRILEDNHRVIGWGGTWPIAATVVDAEGNIVQQMTLPNYVNTYRVLKYEWENAVFDTRERLSLGNYAGTDEWKYNKLYIFNTCNKIVTITSVYHESDVLEVAAELPISIFPGTYKHIEVGFKTGEQGNISDRFTLNFDNQDNSQRIATQLDVVAYYDQDVPSVQFTPAYDSTGVSPLSTVRIAFSEPVKKVFGGEVQNSDIPFLVELKETFNSGDEVSFSGVINEDKTLITLFPDQPLKDNQQYFVKLLGNTLIDDDENVIKLDEESYFTTGLITAVPAITKNGYSIFPNPTEGKFTIVLPLDRNRKIKIFSAGGKLVFDEEHNKYPLHIDLTSEASGIYFLQISDEEENILHSARIIKH